MGAVLCCILPRNSKGFSQSSAVRVDQSCAVHPLTKSYGQAERRRKAALEDNESEGLSPIMILCEGGFLGDFCPIACPRRLQFSRVFFSLF